MPLAGTPGDEELISSLLIDLQEEGIAPIPSITPIVVNGVILIRTPDTLLAIDFESGKRIWEYPWGETAQSLLEDGLNPRTNLQRREQLKERLLYDSAYGQLATDGRSVFFVDELAFVSPKASNSTRILRNQPLDPRRFTNELVALDVATQGKYRWRVGGLTGGDEPQLARTFFLGPPLVLGNQLYVLGEVRGDLNLYVLDSESGQLVWSQLLAHVGQVNISIDGIRRLAGASPSYSDGILICPTSAGAVVAVDTATRSLIWGRQYERETVDPARQRRGVVRFNGSAFNRMQSSDNWWLDSSAVMGDGHVLLTPRISNKLHCVDLLDGTLKWSVDRLNDELQFVAGIHAGKAIVIANSQVMALNLEDGEAAWQLALDAKTTIAQLERPSGRGFFSENQYFLPTTKRLVVIDVEKGEISSEIQTEGNLGNLICYRGQVLSITPLGLTVFHQVDRLRESVTARLEKAPNDPWALAHRGLLQIDAGRADEALPSLRQAFERYEDSDEREVTRSLLVETLLTVIGQQGEPSPKLMSELEGLIDRPAQRERFLLLRGQKMLAAGRILPAFESYIALGQRSLPTPIPYGTRAHPMIVSSTGKRQVRRDRLVRSGVLQCLQAATDSERSQMERRLAIEISAALDSGNPQVIRDALAAFADADAAPALRLWLAKHYLSLGDYLRTEQMLLPLLNGDDVPKAWAIYAECMAAAGRMDLASSSLARIRRDWPTAEVADGLSGVEFCKLPAFDSISSKANAAWPYGRVEVKQLTGAELPPDFRVFTKHQTVLLKSRFPTPTGGLQIAYDASGPNSIIIRDANGQARVRIPRTTAQSAKFRSGTVTAKTMGHLTLINYGRGLLAIDALTPNLRPEQTILWPDSFRDDMSSTDRSSRASSSIQTNVWGQSQSLIRKRRVHSIGPVGPAGILFLQANRLQCVDPATGDLLWSRNDITPESRVWGAEKTVIVAAPGSSRALAFRILDGSRIGEFEIPTESSIWDYVGAHVLSWDDDAPHRLRLTDVIANRTLWQQEFAPESRGYLTRENELAIVEPSGRFLLLDARTGQLRFEQKLERTHRKLASVILRSYPDQYLLIRNLSPVGRAPKSGEMSPFPDQVESPMIDGEIYAFHRDNGEFMWPTPAVIEGYGLPRQQAGGLPILTFVRQITRRERNTRPRPRLDLLCIDRRDGRSVLHKKDLKSGFGSYSIVGDAGTNSIALRLLNTHNYQLTFTGEPQPPAPPVQTGSSRSQENAGLSDIFGAVMDAWGRRSKVPKTDQDDPENQPEQPK